MTGYIYISTVASYLLTPQIATHVYARGGKPTYLKTHIFYPSHARSRYVTGFGAVGMLTFMLTCVTCTSDVTSLGWGGGDVNVHVNLRHMHI